MTSYPQIALITQTVTVGDSSVGGYKEDQTGAFSACLQYRLCNLRNLLSEFVEESGFAALRAERLRLSISGSLPVARGYASSNLRHSLG